MAEQIKMYGLTPLAGGETHWVLKKPTIQTALIEEATFTPEQIRHLLSAPESSKLLSEETANSLRRLTILRNN